LESLPADIRYLPSDVKDGDDKAFDFQGPVSEISKKKAAASISN
jgi:hypothetical protein